MFVSINVHVGDMLAKSGGEMQKYTNDCDYECSESEIRMKEQMKNGRAN